MYRWHKQCLLFVTFCLSCSFCHDTTHSDERIVYIAVDSGISKSDCPVEECHSLTSVLRNQSHFFNSNTTLELLPGTHYITEEVGQVLITSVSNFVIQGSSLVNGPEAKIVCQPGATLGFTFLLSQNVEIINIKISNCSAAMDPKNGKRLLYLALKADYKHLHQYLKQNFTSCRSTHESNNLLCYISIAAFNNTNVTIHKTSILHSKGVGLFSVGNRHCNISESVLKYNKVNCISFITSNISTSFSVVDSTMSYGRVGHDFNLASGLNLFVLLGEQSHDIRITRVDFENNIAPFGNAYLVIHIHTKYKVAFVPDIEVNILITDIKSVQSLPKPMFGYVVRFDIDLGRKASSIYTYSYETECNRPMPLIYNFYDGTSDVIFPNSRCDLVPKWVPPSTSPHRNLTVVLQRGNFIGSCVSVSDSKVQRVGEHCRFEMNDVTITESKCGTALRILNTDVRSSMELSNLSIISSLHNILLVDIGGNGLYLTGNTSFMFNKGTISLLRGTMSFKDFANVLYVATRLRHTHAYRYSYSTSSRVSLCYLY